MNSFLKWLAKTPVGNAAGIFVAVFITSQAATWTHTGVITFAWTDVESWIIPAFAASVIPIARWLNPEDQGYGNGSRNKDTGA